MIATLILAMPVIDARPAPAEALTCSSASDNADKPFIARPVVIVHGWTDNAGSPGIVALRDQLARDLGDHNVVLRFDYSTANTIWAADDLVAQCLADYIGKASTAYTRGGGDGQVVLVGHSMGGLAARFAAMKTAKADIGSDKPVSAMIRGIITIDTPNEGSPLGGLAALIREGALTADKILEQPLWKQQLLVLAQSLRVFVEHADAGICLADENTRLVFRLSRCAMPDDTVRAAGIPALAIATHVRLRNGLFTLDWGTSDTGWDGIVANTSALAYSNTVTRNGQTLGGTATATCTTSVFDVPARLRQLGVDQPWVNSVADLIAPSGHPVRTAAEVTTLASTIFATLTAACWHVSAPAFPAVGTRVADEIGKLDVIPVSTFFDPIADKWFGGSRTLNIGTDGRVAYDFYVPCYKYEDSCAGPGPHPNSITVNLQFTDVHDLTATGTVESVDPAQFEKTVDTIPSVGQTFTLTTNSGRDRLYISDYGTTPFCRTPDTAGTYAQC